MSTRFARWILGALILTAVNSLGAAPPASPQRQLILQAPPATSVSSVAVSPDGSLVATAAGEGGVRLYDAHTGNLLRVIGDAGDRCVVFSPDGKSLTAAGFHMDKLTALWDVNTGERLKTFAGHTEWEADATAISPNGKLLASTGTDKQILVWDIATGKLLHQLKDQPARVAALAFSPDSTMLASGGGDRIVRLWDVATGKLRRSLDGHRDWICTLAFSPDGRALASGSCEWGTHRGHDWPRSPSRGEEQSEWRLWEVATGNLSRAVSEKGRLLSVAFAPSGQSLACAVGNEIKLYELASAGQSRILARHDADVTSIAFAPDGSAVLSASHDQTVRRTALATGNVEWQAPGYFEQVNSVAISPDGLLLITGSGDHRFARGRLPAQAPHLGSGAVRLWDLRTGRMLRRLGDSTDQIMAVAISTDGRHVAAGGAAADGRGVAHFWEVATGTQTFKTTDQATEVLAIAFSPDNKSPDNQLLATGNAGGTVKISDARSGQSLQTLPGHEGGATSLAFSPDGKMLYCGEAPGGARTWDVASGRLVRASKTPGSKAESFTIDRRMNSIGLTRDGAILATCGSSVNNEYVDSVKLWDARTGELTREFSAENIHGRPMALSPDGALLATGGKSVKLWDARTGRIVRELFGHLKRTQSIAFSADGRILVAGGSYGTTNIWDVASGRHLVTLFAFAKSRNAAAADDWFAYTPDGDFDGSPSAEKYLAWRVGDALERPAPGQHAHRPEKISEALTAARGSP